VVITALGFFLPFLLVLIAIAIPITIIAVRQARRHRRSPVSSTPDAPAAETPTTEQEAGSPPAT
jgi:SNF family Na+-dependent transporter